MRKTFITIASLLMSLVMTLTFFSGCNLISVDGKKDMNQVVATVKISDEMPGAEVILKKDIVMSYLNYGYMYEYNYGYTRDKVIKMIVNSLITNRVYVQNAMIELDQANAAPQQQKFAKWNIDRYLTDTEIADAKYQTYKGLNDLIKSYLDNEEKVQDSMPEAVRAVPTGAAKEVAEPDKAGYVQKGFLGEDFDANKEDVKEAYGKVIDLLESNELLGEYENDLTQTDYYKDSLKSNKEQILIENFENKIINATRATVLFSELEEVFKDKYDTQKNMDATAFAEKLSSATASDPILVGRDGTYGYVYNLLLGASDELVAKLDKWDVDNPKATIAEHNEEREKIFKDITAKDLRYSWIWSGYDGTLSDDGTFTFTGDYTLVKDDSLPFQGKVKLLNPTTEQNEDYVAEYSITKTETYNLDDFISIMEKYVYGAEQTDDRDINDSVSVYKKVNTTVALDNYDERINELIFAFSTDDGSLNTYKGYSITPVPAPGKNETYMQEFADAGRKLIDMGDKSYIMVATDYGYHIMFYSEKVDSSYNFATLEDYLDDVYGAKNWEEELKTMLADWDNKEYSDHFLYTLFESVASTKVNGALTEKQNDILNKYVYGDGGYVVKYESRYADIITA